MIRLSLRYFYRLGVAIHPLTELAADQTIIDAWGVLNDAQTALTGLFDPGNFVARGLKSSWEAGPVLMDALNALLAKPDWTVKLTFMDVYPVQNAAKEFETKFTGEIHFTDAYFVVQKGGLDTIKIISDATILFPADLSAKAPEAVADVREAGKCIAFELGTAAGFHLFRATESVLRRYFDAVSGGKRRPRNRNIAAYLEAMRKLKVGDAKVLAVLDQIRDLHRNPLMHPEETLTVDDAIDLLGIVRSAVGTMLRHVPMPRLVLTPPPEGALQQASQQASEAPPPA